MKLEDQVTWTGWGKYAPAPIRCKGKIVKILSQGPNGWAVVEKANGHRCYVSVKKLELKDENI